MRVLMIALPGAGKGTQGALIAGPRWSIAPTTRQRSLPSALAFTVR